MLSKLILVKIISLSIFFCFIQKEPEERIIDFLNAENYNYSSSKKDIPKFALDYLSEIEKNKQPHFYNVQEENKIFQIGDSTELKDINLTDSFICNSDGTPFQKYTRKLNFILYNDSICLMTYISNQADVIDFIQQRQEKIKHIRYNAGIFIENVDSLKLVIYSKNELSKGLIINTFE